MPILIILTWCIFPYKTAAIVSLFEFGARFIESKFPAGSNMGHKLSNTIMFIAYTVMLVPLLLIISSKIIEGGENIPANIWIAIVSYFEIFKNISSIEEFADAVSNLLMI